MNTLPIEKAFPLIEPGPVTLVITASGRKRKRRFNDAAHAKTTDLSCLLHCHPCHRSVLIGMRNEAGVQRPLPSEANS